MKINHIAIWTTNLERMVDFYAKYFNVKIGDRYINEVKGFESIFLSFDDGPKIELMKIKNLLDRVESTSSNYCGYAHVAISVGSIEKVDELTSRLKNDGYSVLNGPRRTGDGYYESVVLDIDKNQIEITE